MANRSLEKENSFHSPILLFYAESAFINNSSIMPVDESIQYILLVPYETTESMKNKSKFSWTKILVHLGAFHREECISQTGPGLQAISGLERCSLEGRSSLTPASGSPRLPIPWLVQSELELMTTRMIEEVLTNWMSKAGYPIFWYFFSLTPINDLRIKKKSNEPTISPENEIEKWHLRQPAKTVPLF